ncbi:MAG: T9SS type A sorting domain-containing protein, partial [Bacteroidia bacterium]|nr:T9SS type A sorting domain-containing protein [Bacteroidia bacterium]
FTANWTAVPGATNYRIDVAIDAAFTTMVPGYNNANAGSGTSFVVTGLVAGTTYYYRVRVNTPCVSANSTTGSVTTTMPTTVQWLGGGSNNWFSGINWTCGVVPNASINVFIDAASPNFWPIISGGAAACNNLTINTTNTSTATRLQVTGSNSTLSVHGNLTVNAHTSLPGFTMVVDNGAKLYNNINPTSVAWFGPNTNSGNNRKQLWVKDPGSEAQFRTLHITAGIPCAPAGSYGVVATFQPWGSCAHPGVLFSDGAKFTVAGNVTIGWITTPAPMSFEGILWMNNAEGTISGDVNVHNQFTASASRGIGLRNGATLDIVGAFNAHTDGASLILESNSFAQVGSFYTNTNFGLPSGSSVVNSTLVITGDVQLRQNCGIGVVSSVGGADLVIDGNLLINTPHTVSAMLENLVAKSEDPMFPASVWVNGIVDVTDRRRILLWENSTMTVSGVDVFGNSMIVRGAASCTLRTTASLYTQGHFDLRGSGTPPGADTARVVFDGPYYSEPNFTVMGNLNIHPNTHLDASNTTVRPLIQVAGNWNRMQNNITTGANRRGFARGISTVAFIGTATGQFINTPAADPIERFYGLDINSYHGVTLNGSAKAEVYNLLNLIDGIFTTGMSNYVWVRTNTPTSVNRIGGHVNGWLYRDVVAHASYYEFPLGKGGTPPAYTHFRRMALKFNGVSGFTRVDTRFEPSPATNVGSCPTVDGISLVNPGANGYWVVNPNSSPYTTDYDMRLYLYGMGTFTDNNFIAVSRDDASSQCNDWGTAGGTIEPPNGDGRLVAHGYAFRKNLTTFSSKVPASGSVPLAVEFLDFNAEAQNDRVLLTWRTLFETDNDYFAIERSGENGVQFSEIGRVKGAGTTYEPQSYRTFDLAPLPGTSYYRLKQTDFDGRSSYSRIVSVTFEPTGDKVIIYPNPTQEGSDVRVRFVSVGDRNPVFELMDLTGRIVWQHTDDQREGEVEIPTSTLSAGVYVFKTNLSPVTQKLVVH